VEDAFQTFADRPKDALNDSLRTLFEISRMKCAQTVKEFRRRP